MPEILGLSKSIYGFDPKSIPGCKLWLDATDSNATGGGTTLTSWKDKSSNAYTGTASSSGAAIAIASNYQNGLPCVVFSATLSQYINFGNVINLGTTGLSIFIAAKTTFVGGTHQSFIAKSVFAGQAGRWGYIYYNSLLNFTLDTAGSGLDTTYSATPYSGNFSIFEGVWDRLATSAYVNATLTAGITAASTSNLSTASPLYVGAYQDGTGLAPAAGLYYNGGIGEILVYSDGLSESDRQSVEGYLAWKWGIRTSLPATHSLYPVPPFARQFNPVDMSPLLWFDAADSRTITTSGTTVTSWTSKGSVAISATTRSGILTSGVSAFNGLNIITCPGSANLGFSAGIPSQARAWFAVFKQTSQVQVAGSPGLLQYFAVVNQTTGNGQDSIGGPGTPSSINTNSYEMGEGASGIVANISTNTAPNGFNVMKQYGWVNGSVASSNFITVDGVSMTLTASLAAASYQTASVLYEIGDRYGNSCHIAEIIFYNRDITVGERQRIEGYLSKKWGLAALPATHPYFKITPPSTVNFLPIDLGACVLWLDGDDPAGTGVRPANGTTVSSWVDKSGAGNNMTGYVSTPYTTSLFNGCGGIAMSGSSNTSQGSYFLSTSSSVVINAQTTCTAFIMCYIDTTSTGASRLISTSYTGQITADFNDTKTFEVQWYPSPTGIQLYRASFNINTAPNSYATLVLFSIVFDGTNMYFYKSGTLLGSRTSSGNFGFDTVAIGRYLPGGNYSFNGYALEYVMYTSALSTSQREKVEGYLSWKWGAVSALPTIHGYKLFHPMQEKFRPIIPSTISSVTLSVSDTGATIVWTQSTNAVGYEWFILRSFGPFLLFRGKVGNGSTLTVSVTSGLFMPNTNYYADVRPYSSTGTNGATTTSPTASYSGSNANSVNATGGTTAITGGRKFHTFTANGSFVLIANPISTQIEVMAIGGGGGGGCQSGGGGGAGNMIIATTTTLGNATYTITIGGGGIGGTLSTSRGTNGANTTFASTITALGGGGGGTYSIAGGANGGCGGGGAELGQLAPGAAGFGTVSSPFTAVSNLATAGGTGINNGSMGGAGGGGTAVKGTNQIDQRSAGTAGGAGTLYRGSYYGGGGGGTQGGTYWGPPYNGGAGGIGGGGTGSSFTSNAFATAGTANTGGGGGGASGATGDTTGASGGSGICIISYVFP